MPKFMAKCLTACTFIVAIAMHNNNVYAADAAETLAEIKAQLEEAKKLLAEDTADHQDTAQKKIEIDRELAARLEREAEIQEELKQLCEEQDKVKPGTLVSCMAKLDN